MAWDSGMSTISNNQGTSYNYRGVRVLVLLHEWEIKRFVESWKTAKESGPDLLDSANR
jgi:hypothetical protein